MSSFVGPFDDHDRYELVEITSRGAEGELWRGTISVDGQQLPVAVKILHEVSGPAFEEAAQRWKRQGELLRSLDHPGLVKVREVFEGPAPHEASAPDPSTRTLYLVMNWAAGESVPTWCASHPDRDGLEVTRVVSKMASAVNYLHSGVATGGVPVLHRDIKPANVIVDGPDVRLVDFGFARLAGNQPTMAGTPSYLAPEILAGEQPTEASDRFSLGATAYFLYTGEDPDHNVVAMKGKIVQVRGLEGRQDIADHLLAMMAPDPTRRPRSVVEWAQALTVGTVSERIPQEPPPPEMPPPMAPSEAAPSKRGRKALVISLVVVVILALVAGVAFALSKKTKNQATQQAASVVHVVHTKKHPTTTTTAKPTRIPNVVGESLASASNTLKGLGLTVTESDVVNTTVADGTVLSQTPTAGSAITTAPVTLQIARQPVGTFLDQLHAVSGEVSNSPATVSGVAYAHAIELNSLGPYDTDTDDVQYDLGRNYQQFTATVGLSDDSDNNAQMQIEVIADGRTLFTQTFGLGQTAAVKVDVTGVLRLELTATLVNSGNGSGIQNDSTPVFGDAEVFGVPSQVPGYGSSGSSSSTTTTF